MISDITMELQKVFHEATMRMEASSLTDPQDWAGADEIIKRHDANRAELERKYQEERETRIEIVRKRLINEAGELNFDHPTPIGNDRFNGEAINTRAINEVERDHERVLQQSRETEKTEMDAHREQARQRDAPKVQPRGDFTQAVDRRVGPDRRAPTR